MRPTRVSAGKPATRLVDSVPWAESFAEDGSGVLRRIEVRSKHRVDTLDRILTLQDPLVVGDSLLLGMSYDTLGTLLGVFRYDRRDGSIRNDALPTDYNRASDLALSPDGRHLAYVRFDTSGATGVVRKWPSGEMIVTTAPLRVPAGDVMRGAARWTSRIDFELLIDPFELDGSRWVRYRGRIGRAGLMVDTLHLSAR